MKLCVNCINCIGKNLLIENEHGDLIWNKNAKVFCKVGMWTDADGNAISKSLYTVHQCSPSFENLFLNCSQFSGDEIDET